MLEEARPSPVPPIQFKKNPPAKKKKYGKAERGEEGRAVLRAGGVRVGTRAERAKNSQATTHAERVKSVEIFAKIGSSGVQ